MLITWASKGQTVITAISLFCSQTAVHEDFLLQTKKRGDAKKGLALIANLLQVLSNGLVE